MSKTNGKDALNEAMPEITLRDLMSPLFRHRRVVLTVFSAVFICSLLLAIFWAGNYYVANMQVVVEQDRSDPAVTSGQTQLVANNKVVTTDQVSSEVALLQGTDIMRATAGACGLDQGWTLSQIFFPSDPARRQAMKLEKATQRLAKGVKVDVETTSDVINVSYGKLGAPETPACVLQNLSKLYLEKHLQLHRPSGSTAFFADETNKYQQAMNSAEAQLAGFSRSEGVAAPDVLRTNMAQQVAISTAALYQAQQLVAADKKRLESIDEQMKATPSRSSTSEVSNSSNLLMQNLGAQLLAAKLKRTQLLLKYDPAYPLVQEAEQEIQETETAIATAQNSTYLNKTTDRDPTYEYLREDRAKTRDDLASQEATAEALVSSIKNMRLEMVKLDGETLKQNALVREAKADEANYLLYLNKREQERTSDALDLKRIANVAIAVPPVVPVLPAHSPLFVAFVGLVLGVFLGLASGYVAEYLDPSFRTPTEVAETLSIPVLACVPRRVA